MEVRGVVRNITVVDDFGHHPTAIRETLKALRQKYPARRIWAVFEPRSNTTRRNVFQRELAEALALANATVVAEVARADQLPPGQRLDAEQLMCDLAQAGIPSAYLPNVDAIVSHLVASVVPGEVICVFSNGGFGGIHAKLLKALADS